jgi:hypothetical protein
MIHGEISARICPSLSHCRTVASRCDGCATPRKGVRKQIGTKVNAQAATDAARKYADRRCKGGTQLGEGDGDYVYHSIHGMAKA